MGCGKSKQQPAEPELPPEEDWPLRAEAVRVFKLADYSQDGKLDLSELSDVRLKCEADALKMLESLDENMNGTVELSEWLKGMKETYDKSPKGCEIILSRYAKSIERCRVRKSVVAPPPEAAPPAGNDDATASATPKPALPLPSSSFGQW